MGRMRVRVRGPSGQSVVNFDPTATISELLDEISSKTAIARSNLTIKYGYPPKVLQLSSLSEDSLVADLDVRLDGEQLTVSGNDTSSGQETMETQPTQPTITNFTSQVAKDSQYSNQGSHGEEAGSFSFGNFGSAPSTAPPVSTNQGAKKDGPLGLQRKKNNVTDDPPEIIMPEHQATMVLRIMPDDNSCLFRAIAQAVTPEMDTMNELRAIVAATIQANPEKYSKVVLDDKEPDDYCRWIQTEDAWGGQIELDILSQHFDIEISSIDVQTLRVDRYNEGQPTRCIVVYSGIHYDTIALAPFDAPPESDIKVFEVADDGILASALALCQTLQDRRYYTDTAGFKIRCNDCGSIVVGERGATEHATQTGHYNFGEDT